jgi:hypothetical protein
MLTLRAAVKVRVPPNSSRCFNVNVNGIVTGKELEFVAINGTSVVKNAEFKVMKGRTRLLIRNDYSKMLSCRRGEVIGYLKNVERNEPLLRRGEQGLVRNEPLLERMEIHEHLFSKGNEDEPVLRREQEVGNERNEPVLEGEKVVGRKEPLLRTEEGVELKIEPVLIREREVDAIDYKRTAIAVSRRVEPNNEVLEMMMERNGTAIAVNNKQEPNRTVVNVNRTDNEEVCFYGKNGGFFPSGFASALNGTEVFPQLSINRGFLLEDTPLSLCDGYDEWNIVKKSRGKM